MGSISGSNGLNADKKMDEVTTLTFPLSEIVAISRLGAEQQHIAVFALRGILATIWRVNK